MLDDESVDAAAAHQLDLVVQHVSDGAQLALVAEALDQQVGNPKIGLEWAVHTGLGAEWRPSPRWLVDGEAYLIERRDLVELSEEVDRDPATGELVPVNFANSRTG